MVNSPVWSWLWSAACRCCFTYGPRSFTQRVSSAIPLHASHAEAARDASRKRATTVAENIRRQAPVMYEFIGIGHLADASNACCTTIPRHSHWLDASPRHGRCVRKRFREGFDQPAAYRTSISFITRRCCVRRGTCRRIAAIERSTDEARARGGDAGAVREALSVRLHGRG